MATLAFVFLGIAGLFFLLLGAKALLAKKGEWEFCVICLTVTLGWIGMLGLLAIGRFDEPVLVGIFMGQTILAIYSLLERKGSDGLKLFRLPFLLTATFVAYLALAGRRPVMGEGIVFTLVWGLFFVVFLLRFTEKGRKIAESIVRCCGQW